MTLARFGFLSAATLAVACSLVVVALVLVRLGKDRAERRRLTLRAPVWRVVLTLSSGEGDEVDAAYTQLLATTPAERQAVVSDAFALLPKLRGDARDRLRQVLRAWGTADNARHSTTSRSAVRRCRGFYRLGVLAELGRRDQVLTGLDDRDFVVRRTAMLALGSFPDPVVVGPMLDRAVLEPQLRRDFLASIDRIGAPAVPALREQLATALEQSRTEPEQGDRRGQLAAEALGLVGAIDAVGSLEQAMPGAPDEMQIACINALGALGSPTSVPALTSAALHDNPDVRRVAVQSLGLIGGRGVVTPLSIALQDDNVEVARAAANALHRSGPGGRQVLRESPAPVSREVLALAALGAHASGVGQ